MALLSNWTQVNAQPHPLVLNVYRFELWLVLLPWFYGKSWKLCNIHAIHFTCYIDRIVLLHDGCIEYYVLGGIYTFGFVEVSITQELIFLSSLDNLCRFRWYPKGLAQFCSVWILVLTTTDRCLRTRFPFKTKQGCTRRKALTAILVVVMIGTGLYSHILNAQFFGKRFPGIATETCGSFDFQGSCILFYFS